MSYINYINVTSNLDMNVDGNDGFLYFLVDCSSGNINIDLYSDPIDSQNYIIHRIDSSSNTLTLTATNSKMINGSSSTTININTYADASFLNGNWLCSKFTFSL